ncbi:MAG: hypothetical protein V1816_16970 [Pseudomonadota bacterium]
MTGNLDMRQIYVAQLRIHAHELIAGGYRLLDAPSFATQEETAITGELVRCMKEFMESNEASGWAVHYDIAEDPPLNVAGRLGKSRPRVDIEFLRTGAPGARPRLLFEAKRLQQSSGHTVGVYLGRDGLGCFLSGKYPITHGEAGMLGYIQSGSESEWSNKIEKALSDHGERYGVTPPAFQPRQLCSLKHTYLSRHHGRQGSGYITIHHVLLLFH